MANFSSPRAQSQENFQSFNWLRGVSDDKHISVIHRLVLIRLVLHRQKDGRCDPGYDVVADELGVGRATVFGAVDFGIKRGWLADFPEHGGRTKRNFVFTFPAQQSPSLETVQQSPNLETVGKPTVYERQSNSLRNTPQQSTGTLQPLDAASEFAPNGQNGIRERGKSQTQLPDFISRGKGKRTPAAGESEGKPARTTNADFAGKPEFVASVQWFVTKDMRQQLYDGGFSKREVDQFEGPEGRDILNGKLTLQQAHEIAQARLDKRERDKEPERAERFDEFWRAYPKHVGKEETQKVFAKLDGADVEKVIAGAKRYAIERTGQDPKYTKHPRNWLKEKLWEDEPSGAPIIDQEGNPLDIDIERPPPQRQHGGHDPSAERWALAEQLKRELCGDEEEEEVRDGHLY